MAEAEAIRPLGALRRHPTPSAKGTIGDLGHTADFHPRGTRANAPFPSSCSLFDLTFSLLVSVRVGHRTLGARVYVEDVTAHRAGLVDARHDLALYDDVGASDRSTHLSAR